MGWRESRAVHGKFADMERLLREYRGNGNQSWSFPAWKELINAGNAKDLYTVVKVAYCGQVEQGSSWDKGVDGDGEYGT